jgi:hypothetical protein
MAFQFRAHQFWQRLLPAFESPTLARMFLERISKGEMPLRMRPHKAIQPLGGVLNQAIRFGRSASLSNDKSFQDRQRAFRLAPIQASL